MKTNYILVDFENVQPGSLAAPSGTVVKVLIFLGEQQTKIPVDLAISLQSLGESVSYLQITGSGKNALDFHIAYWIGRLVEQDPKACVHVVSKDKGFDPLIKHLRKSSLLVHRVEKISDIQILNGQAGKSTTDRVEHVKRSLIARGNSRPRKRATLRNTIASMFMKSLSEEELDALIEDLVERGLISIEKEIVAYHLS